MQLGHSEIMVYIFLIFLNMSFLELDHFGITLHNWSSLFTYLAFNPKYTFSDQITLVGTYRSIKYSYQ